MSATTVLIKVLGEIHLGYKATIKCPKCGATMESESDMRPPECWDCAWTDLDILKEIVSPF